MRSVGFAVHPEVREREEGKGWKGPKERRIFGRARKKTRKKENLCRLFYEGHKAIHMPQSDSANKVTTEITNGKDILLYPIFFSFFKIKFKRMTEA